ncbi:DsbA family protein [Pedosphaera parvula]|uniref:DSBA oxidoreductase n=1 Tax=Pedosphaera parvula (strain Ellin514) TaxID=320771 RepID=B9XF55_PEDPL|nr:DsbA family protein [Pedosphaera parvula]EEF61553.1 DSBA oxidoreductase [Pedosphaera parvula Ellin514]
MKQRATTHAQAPKLAVPISKRDHMQGSIKAPLNLVEYGDYECPYCGLAHPVVKEVQSELGDRLCFVFRNFPLVDMHPHAETAAEAAEAAGAQGQFWEMHDILYENQHALDDEDLISHAAKLDLDMERLVDELDEGVYRPRVEEDFQSGVRSGVSGTPAFFVNGFLHEGEYDFDTLVNALMETREQG